MTKSDNEIEYEKAKELAKVEYHAAWRVSDEVFTKRASEILGVPIDRIQVRRYVGVGENWGKLYVYVFNDTEDQRFYALRNGERVYEKLPTNINEFSEMLTLKKQESL